MDLSVTPGRFRAAFMTLHNAFRNGGCGVSEIDVATPQRYRFAGTRALPKLKEHKTIIVWPLGPESLEDRFPLFGLVGLMLFFVSVSGNRTKKSRSYR